MRKNIYYRQINIFFFEKTHYIKIIPIKIARLREKQRVRKWEMGFSFSSFVFASFSFLPSSIQSC
jgi:hypothetical protein